MARTISKTATVSTKKTVNPWQQPCFAVWVNEYSNHGCGYTLFDHNYNQIGYKQGDGNSAYSSYRSYTSYAPEFMNERASNSYLNTQSYPSSSDHYGNNTCWVGYLGHMFHLSVNPYSSEPGWMRVNDAGFYSVARAFRDVITLPGEDHQDYAIFLRHNGNNNYFRITSRSSFKYYHQDNWGWGNMNISCKQNSGNAQGMHGCGSYNRKLKKFLVMENFNGSSSFRVKPTVYDGVPNLRAYGNADSQHANKPESYTGVGLDSGPLYDHFTNASANYDVDRYNEYNENNRHGNDEASWRGQCVLCDNERIVLFRLCSGGSSGYAITRWNGPNEATNPGQHNGEWIFNQSGHHHYGYEQGDRFGSRFQQSSDGRYVWLYGHHYYYGAGCYMCIVRVSDGKVIHWNYTDTGHGWMPYPVGKCNIGFVTSWDSNPNHNGCWWNTHNLDKIFAEQDDGSQFSFENGMSQYTLDVCGNSTNYPVIVPAMYDTSLFSEPHIDEFGEPNTAWPPSS